MLRLDSVIASILLNVLVKGVTAQRIRCINLIEKPVRDNDGDDDG